MCSGAHEVYNDCGPDPYCEASCTNLDPLFCAPACLTGCYCEEGFVRNDAWECIPEEQCHF